MVAGSVKQDGHSRFDGHAAGIDLLACLLADLHCVKFPAHKRQLPYLGLPVHACEPYLCLQMMH
jgi:hypothetical protein